ncbi:MAG: chemotaxis protein CheW [Gemmatimonadaceae bacterium]|nr:chemotaxis protein CheW [Gemmatimonadaceae bacterium]
MLSAFTTPTTAQSPILPPSSDDDADVIRPRELIVEVAGQTCGIPITQVREVVRIARITRVPGAPASVRGVINVRGAVVTVLELSVLLGAQRAVTGTSVVLLEHGTRWIGVAVDAVRDVREIPESDSQSTRAGADDITPIDAVALCAPHLLSSEEMGR